MGLKARLPDSGMLRINELKTLFRIHSFILRHYAQSSVNNYSQLPPIGCGSNTSLNYHSLKVSLKPVHWFVRYFANRQS